MTNDIASSSKTSGIFSTACITVLAFAFTVALSEPAYARRIPQPPVPAKIQLPAGTKAFLEGHASGTQNYVCLPSGSAFAWAFFGPQATLFNDVGKQVITHFLSPNPFEGGVPRATWQHSGDTSTAWALAIETSSDPLFVAPGAIPWLLLQVVGSTDGPNDGHRLTATTFIQRVNTSGGVAPSTGCSQSTDVGKKVLVPYTADYFFYRYPRSDEDDDN